ncbi:MAG: tRNA lysidine(34) synthetase TilS, partial [Anaerolineales bacterium]
DREVVLPDGVLRVREEGDDIKPLGMGGKTIKLSYLMINEKIPAPYRENWPLVAGQEGVLWVPGGRLSRESRITEKTVSVLELRFIRRKA